MKKIERLIQQQIPINPPRTLKPKTIIKKTKLVPLKTYEEKKQERRKPTEEKFARNFPQKRRTNGQKPFHKRKK